VKSLHVFSANLDKLTESNFDSLFESFVLLIQVLLKSSEKTLCKNSTWFITALWLPTGLFHASN